MYPKVASLVNDAKCQSTFGLFTKWDKCVKKSKSEDGDTFDEKEARKMSEQDFRKALELQCEVFFVDVKRVTNNDVSLLHLHL